MICMVSGVEIHDGDVWIVEIVGEECTPTYRYILRAEIETDWVWSENGESHTVVPMVRANSCDGDRIVCGKCDNTAWDIVKDLKLL